MGVLDTISTVTNFFANIGASSVDILNRAIKILKNIVLTTAKMMKKKKQ